MCDELDTDVKSGVENIDEWRKRALDFLEANRGVFVLEAYTVSDFVLQVRISIKGVCMEMNLRPWCMVDGRSYSEESFRQAVQHLDPEVEEMLCSPCEEFSPTKITNFVLGNHKSVPAIVSSNYVHLMRTNRRQIGFLEHFIYQKILPGSQRCCLCNQMATTIELEEPENLYCSRHVKMNNMIRLYNPLVVAFTAHSKRIVLSVLNLDRVYSPRFDNLSRFLKGSNVLTLIWTALCKKNQPLELGSSRSMEMYYETAKNHLECAEQHLLRDKYHDLLVKVRHSLTCCLLKKFLFERNNLCDLSSQSDEDVPYDWWSYHT